jgi:hypothetical protein
LLRRAALVFAGVFVLGLLLCAGGGVASAQTWKPKRKKKPTADKTEPADASDKRKPKAKRKPRKPTSSGERVVVEAGDDDDVVDEEVIDEDELEEAPDSIVIDDDLDDVGPDARISDADLTTDATTGAGSNTRLETKVMTFLRSSVDVVHDEVPDPEMVSGLTPNGEDVLGFWFHGRAEGVGRFGRRMKVKVAGRFDAEMSLDSNTNFGTERYEGRVWDTYADLYTSKIDLRVGNQFVAWGVADLLSPNDVVNARDLRRGFLMHPDDLRLPVFAASATLHDGPFEIHALYVPVAPTNRFELLDGDYALLGPNGATALERKVGAIVSALQNDPMVGLGLRPILDIAADPGHGVETGEVGTSIGLRFRKVDMFGYLLYGHERNPRIELAEGLTDLFLTTAPGDLTAELLAMRIGELGAMGITAVDVDYYRRLHVGGAFATRLEPIGFKLDVGYAIDAVSVIVPPGAGPLLGFPEEHDQLGATASLDYDRGNELTVILEASYTRVIGVPDDRAVYQLDGDELLVFGTRVQWAPGAGPLSLRLLGFVDTRSEPSYAIRPALRLSGHDHLSVEVAAILYGGPETSLGGIQSHNDQIVLTAQYGL